MFQLSLFHFIICTIGGCRRGDSPLHGGGGSQRHVRTYASPRHRSVVFHRRHSMSKQSTRHSCTYDEYPFRRIKTRHLRLRAPLISRAQSGSVARGTGYFKVSCGKFKNSVTLFNFPQEALKYPVPLATLPDWARLMRGALSMCVCVS